MTRFSNKVFPFAPGILWKIKNGKYIMPEMDFEVFHKVIKGKDIVVMCFGGIFESYFSLSIVEHLQALNLENKLYWKGSDMFNSLPLIQGIAKIFPYNFTKKLLNKYPAPLFTDNNNNVYLNCLNDYLIMEGFKGTGHWPTKGCVTEQIFRNSMLAWDKNIPILRNLNSETYIKWARLNKFDKRKPYMLIIPEDTIYSSNKFGTLNWNVSQIKQFASMVTGYLDVVVCTDHKDRFLNSNIYTINQDLKLITELLYNCSFLLSKQIDYNLMSLCMKKGYVLSNMIDKPFDLPSNSKFLNIDKEFYISDNLLPEEAYLIVKEYYG